MALFVTVLFDLLGFGMILPLLPFYAQSLGASAVQIGLLFACFSAGQLVFAPILGRLSDRLGRRPVLLVSISCSVLFYLLFAASPWFGAWGFAVLLTARLGAGASAANFAVAPAYIADVMPAEERSKGMGILGAAFGLGFIGGPTLGGVLGLWGHQAVALGAAGLAAINLALAYHWLPESLSAELRAGVDRSKRWLSYEALGKLRSDRSLTGLLLLFFLVTFCFSLMESTLALFAQLRFDFGQIETTYLFVLIGVVLVGVQGGLVGPLARRLGDRRILLIGISVLAASLLALPYAPRVAALGLACSGLALGSGLVNPSSLALLSRVAGPGDQGEVMGLSQSAGSLARLLGPLAGTALFARVGPGWPFLAGGALMFATLLFAAALMRRIGGLARSASAESL